MNGAAGAIRKAVLLARGLGRRMRVEDAAAALDGEQARQAGAGAKALMPVGGRPFMDYALSALADAGYEQACLVVAPEHDAVREYYQRAARRMYVTFAVQAEPLGTANAVLAAETFVGSEEFLAVNGDNLYSVPVLRELRHLGEPGLALFEPEALVRGSNIPAERVREFAFGWAEHDGYLKQLIEKPDDDTWRTLGPEARVSMNAWRFGPAIFDVCRAAPLSVRGEYELPAAVSEAVRSGRLRLKVVRAAAGVLDLSRRADVAEVTRRLRAVEPNP